MNTPHSKTTAPTRFLVSRAQFSPLARRTAITSSADTRIGSTRTPTKQPSRTLFSLALAPESRAIPNFWSSGDLDRLQPDVTRHHY